MKRASQTLLVSGLILAASPALADWSEYFSANVALTSDYVWRGISQSDEKGAIQGGFDFEHPTGIYLGTWASSVDFNDGGESNVEYADGYMELDFYGGFGHEFSTGIGIDLGAINYRYPGEDSLNYMEYYLGLSYSIFSASINYSNDVYNTSETGLYYTGAVAYDTPDTMGAFGGITLGASIGYYDLDSDAGEDYTDWKLSVGKSFLGLDFEVAYTDTDLSDSDCDGTGWCDSRGFVTVSKSF